MVLTRNGRKRRQSIVKKVYQGITGKNVTGTGIF